MYYYPSDAKFLPSTDELKLDQEICMKDILDKNADNLVLEFAGSGFCVLRRVRARETVSVAVGSYGDQQGHLIKDTKS